MIECECECNQCFFNIDNKCFFKADTHVKQCGLRIFYEKELKCNED